MEGLAERVFAALSANPPAAFYLGLAGSALLETIFPPYPGDTVTVLGGALASGGRLTPIWVWASSVVGCFCGTMLLFVGGRGGARRFLRTRGGVIGTEKNLQRVETWFSRWGKLVVLGSRFVPAVRSLIAVGAGTAHMRITTMAVLSLVGIAAWQGLLVAGGVMLGSNWRWLSTILTRYSQVLVLVAIIALGVLVWAKLAGRRR
jgi:membrane protein DedA with SNARE-associated domain